MKTASIFEAKTNLSRYIADIQSKEEPSILIMKNGKPVAQIVPYAPPSPQRIGIAKGSIPQLSSLDDFNEPNLKIAEKFSETEAWP